MENLVWVLFLIISLGISLHLVFDFAKTSKIATPSKTKNIDTLIYNQNEGNDFGEYKKVIGDSKNEYAGW